MKKLITLILLTTLVSTAFAEHCCYRHGPGFGWGWTGPALIGGVIGYELAQPKTVIVQPQPVYVQPQPVYVQQPPVGYHWQEMVDPATNTIKIVLVPN